MLSFIVKYDFTSTVTVICIFFTVYVSPVVNFCSKFPR